MAWIDSSEILIYLMLTSQPVHITLASPVTAAAFSETGTLLATWEYEQSVRVWDTNSGEMVAERSYAESCGTVADIRFIDNDQTVAFNFSDDTWFLGGKRSNVVSYRANTFRCIRSMGNIESGIYLWDYRAGLEPRSIPISCCRVPDTGLVIDDDATVVSTIGYGRPQNRTGIVSWEIHLLDLQSGEDRGRIGGRGASVNTWLFNPVNTNQVAVLTGTGVVRFWNISESRETFALTLLPYRVRAMAYNADGSHLATGGMDGKVRLWDTETGGLLFVYDEQPADIYQLSFNASGELIALGDPITYPRSWNAITLATATGFREALIPAPLPFVSPTPVSCPRFHLPEE